jgi:hypothetical protein
MNTHLVGKFIEAQLFIEIQGGETPTSPALPELFLHISPSQL